jgi:RimJ/RimL family protein N-acetyltransferase
MTEFRLETPRLVLRGWRTEDRVPFHAMSNDLRVMEFLGPLYSWEEVDEVIDVLTREQADLGHTFWALERREDGAFLGWCGIIMGREGLPIADQPEIGWRLAHAHWGQGYAREAAAASLDWYFANRVGKRVWAITSTGNRASWGLMERLGMARHADMDFDHPRVPGDSPLKRHVTYSIARGDWVK